MAETLERGRHAAVDVLGLAHVPRHRHDSRFGPGGDVARGAFEWLRCASGDHDVSSFRGQLLGDGAADALAGPSDQRDLGVQLKIHKLSLIEERSAPGSAW